MSMPVKGRACLVLLGLVASGSMGCSPGSPTSPDGPGRRPGSTGATLSGVTLDPRSFHFSFRGGGGATLDSSWSCGSPDGSCSWTPAIRPTGFSCQVPTAGWGQGLTVECDLTGTGLEGSFRLSAGGSFNLDVSATGGRLTVQGVARPGSVSGYWSATGTGPCFCNGSGSFDVRG